MPLLFSRVARYGGGLLLVLFAAGYLFWLPFRPVGTPMTDFSSYYSAGRYWAHGGDPYSREIWTVERTLPGVNPSREELLPYVGPPLGLPLWAALALLPYPLAASLWGIVVALCAAALIVIPLRLAGRRIGGRGAVSLLLFALVAGPLVTGISVGQAALPAAVAADIALVCAAYRRWIPMAVATIAAITFKPNDALVIVGSVRELGALVVVAASAALSAVANMPFAGGIHGIAAYAQVLLQQGGAERFFSYQITLTSIAYGFGLGAERAVVLGAALSAIALVVTVVAIRRTRANAIDAGAIACAMFPFIVPFEHEPDLAIVFLPALLVAFRARGWTWAVGAIGTTLLCLDAFAMAQGRLGITFTTVTAFVAGLQLAALAPRGLRWVRLAPLLVVPLVLVVGLYGPPSRLPMWPDSLPQHVAVAPGASASSEWHDEIAASGLDRPRPWTALLRLLTLCGCAGIAAAMIRTAAAPVRSVQPSRRPRLRSELVRTQLPRYVE